MGKLIEDWTNKPLTRKQKLKSNLKEAWRLFRKGITSNGFSLYIRGLVWGLWVAACFFIGTSVVFPEVLDRPATITVLVGSAVSLPAIFVMEVILFQIEVEKTITMLEDFLADLEQRFKP